MFFKDIEFAFIPLKSSELKGLDTVTHKHTTFDDFLAEWSEDINAGNPSTVQIGNLFAQKLITQWLDIDDNGDEMVFCNGSGDGGIDLAFLQTGDSNDIDNDGYVEGDRWYLIQSQYSKAFHKTSNLLDESNKVIDALEGHRPKLSSLSGNTIERLQTFIKKASDVDRITLVFATIETLDAEQLRALDRIRAMGRNTLGSIFDVEAISVADIYRRMEETPDRENIVVPLKSNVTLCGDDLLVGAVSILDLFNFLQAYRKTTNDLDQIYEKNVRKFLGSRRKVNKVMRETLLHSPEKFGLFNNGITIVVNDFNQNGFEGYQLIEPYIVNGCQTTRTIWEVCHHRLNTGGTGLDAELEDWQQRLRTGVVVTKIVKVGHHGESLLRDITRYTNTQNAIQEKDFLALNEDFRVWADQMSNLYDIYLEIQRGGWEARRAYQKQDIRSKQFTIKANAFDLLKVYGAGWMGNAGIAFARNSAFLPSGSVFKQIMNTQDTDSTKGTEGFSVEDLYASFLLQNAADTYGFGRGAKHISRRQTRFVYYMIVIELLKRILSHGKSEGEISKKSITKAIIKLASSKPDVWQAFTDTAIQFIDEYMTDNADTSIFKEPSYKKHFNTDLNSMLKAEKFGSEELTPNLRALLRDYQRYMLRGDKPLRDQIAAAL